MVKVVHDVVVVCRRICLEAKVSAGDFFGCGRDVCWFMAPFLLFPNSSKAVTKAAKQIEEEVVCLLLSTRDREREQAVPSHLILT